MIDRLDARILQLVQKDNRLNFGEIGAKVGLSASAVQRRLARLRKERIIREDVSVVDPAKVGKKLTMVINVTLEREGPDVIARFKDVMRQHPQVMLCYYVTGETDFVLVVSMRDMEEFEQFINEFCVQNPAIKRFSTSVVVDRVKVGLAIPIEISPDTP